MLNIDFLITHEVYQNTLDILGDNDLFHVVENEQLPEMYSPYTRILTRSQMIPTVDDEETPHITMIFDENEKVVFMNIDDEDVYRSYSVVAIDFQRRINTEILSQVMSSFQTIMKTGECSFHNLEPVLPNDAPVNFILDSDGDLLKYSRNEIMIVGIRAMRKM